MFPARKRVSRCFQICKQGKFPAIEVCSHLKKCVYNILQSIKLTQMVNKPIQCLFNSMYTYTGTV